MSTFKKHAATGFVAAFIALPAFAQSPAEHPTTPPPAHEKQAPGVEAHLKVFDVLDFDVFSNQKWDRLGESTPRTSSSPGRTATRPRASTGTSRT